MASRAANRRRKEKEQQQLLDGAAATLRGDTTKVSPALLKQRLQRKQRMVSEMDRQLKRKMKLNSKARQIGKSIAKRAFGEGVESP